MKALSQLPNPFRNNVVQDAWQETTDIAEIHAAAFEACKLGIDSAARGVPDSLLIYGAAGSGKTHVLARLQRHLAETARSAPDNVLRCVFCFVRLQTSPELLWQHVRRRLASDLMRREQGLMQLQRLVAHQLGIVTGRSARAGILELRVLRAEDEHALALHLQEVATRLDLPRNLCTILEQLVFNRNVRDASAWLAGESLPEDVLFELGLGPDVDEDREDEARRIVTALCRLAGSTLPIVFCFDQVESLQRSANDDEALFRFGRMAADLHDADANVFLITCLQAAFLEQLKRAVRTADYDRFARRSVLLGPLTRSQVEALLRSRLDLVPDLASMRSGHTDHPFYPLSRHFVDDLSKEISCVPRHVLALAARAFDEQQQGRPSEAPTTAQFLHRELESRTRQSIGALKAADTGPIVFRGMDVVARMEGGDVNGTDPQQADLLVTGPRRVAISVRNEADGRALTPKLRRLLPHVPRKDGAPLVLVRDSRLPIPKTAVKARECLDTLHQRGVRIVEPTVEALAALDALASILADAKSGDLANQEVPLETGAVVAWLRSLRDEASVEPVVELIEAIFGKDSGQVNAVARDLSELLKRERVIELEAVVGTLKHDSEKILSVARKAIEHCLVLEGPPTVLLDVAGVPAEAEAVS